MSDIGSEARQRRVRLEERVRIDDLPRGTQVLDVWYPLVGDDANQQLLDLRLDLDQPLDVGHDQEHGNPMVHVRLLRPRGPALEFRASCLVSRSDPTRPPAPGATATCAARPLLLRDLEVGLPSAETAELSREAAALAASCSDPLTRAARLGQVAVERCPAAAVERFVHLCRLAGIPARVVAGIRAAVTVGEHLWAEVFVADRGWIAADPVCGAECGSLWELGLDHVSRSRGQDVLLQPVQRGPRLAALRGPYAEVDGRPHPVTTAITASVEAAAARARPAPGARLPDLAALVTLEPDLLDPAPPRIRLPAGALLPPAGGGVWLYLLTAGRVRLSRLTLGGRRLELGMLEAPAFFQADRVRRGMAEALEDSELRPLTREQVLRMARRRPEFGFRLLETFGQRLVESEDRMELLAYQGVPGRLALALLHRLGPRGVVDGVTHQELADVVGASRETVTKVLGQLQAIGCVRLRHRRIEVIDVNRLAASIDVDR